MASGLLALLCWPAEASADEQRNVIRALNAKEDESPLSSKM
jgi:hypothetical protein